MKWLELTQHDDQRGEAETGRTWVHIPKVPVIILFESKTGTSFNINSFSMEVTESPEQIMRQLALIEDQQPPGPITR